jgi:hypothetical protein
MLAVGALELSTVVVAILLKGRKFLGSVRSASGRGVCRAEPLSHSISFPKALTNEAS